jgi:hypothetical protein
VNQTLLRAVAALLLAGCGASTSEPKPLTPVELTVGAMALQQQTPNDMSTALTHAMRDMNTALATVNAAQKGAWRKPVTFTVESRDVMSDEQKAHDVMSEYSALLARVVVTEASNASIGANRWNYEEIAAGKPDMIPLVSYTATTASLNNPAATDPDPIRRAALVDAGDWFFRTCPASDVLAGVRLGYVFHRGPAANGDVNGDGVVKLVWLGTSDASTQGIVAADQNAITAYANNPSNGAAPLVTRNVSFDPPASPETFDFSAIIADALSTSDGHAPDLIVNKTLPTVALPFIKAYKERAGAAVPILEDGSFRRNTVLAALGAAGDGQLGVSSIAYENSVAGAKFAAEQKDFTGWQPAAFEASAYDAMIMAMLAVVKASQQVQVEDPLTQVTPAMVRDNLRTLAVPATQDPNRIVVTGGADGLAVAIKAIIENPGVNLNYDGAGGPVDFDAVGNVSSRAVAWSIQGGQFVEQVFYDCVTSPACPQAPRDPGLTPR